VSEGRYRALTCYQRRLVPLRLCLSTAPKLTSHCVVPISRLIAFGLKEEGVSITICTCSSTLGHPPFRAGVADVPAQQHAVGKTRNVLQVLKTHRDLGRMHRPGLKALQLAQQLHDQPVFHRRQVNDQAFDEELV